MTFKTFFSIFFSWISFNALNAQKVGNLPPIESLPPEVQHRLQYDWAWLEKYKLANEQLKSSQNEGNRLIFLGDSITEGWSDATPNFFETHLHYVNRGIGGQTSGQALLRVRQDVIELQPKKMVLLIGINDIAENNGAYSEDITFGNIVSILELVQLYNIQPIVCSITPANTFIWRTAIENVGDKIIALNQRLEQYAKQRKLPYCDFHSALKNNEKGTKREYTTDGVHLTREGYEVMINTLRKFL
jgi:lysophospholipase L1-like esterase